MANMDHICAICGSKSLRARTSEKVGLLTIEAIWTCNNCGAELQIKSQIMRVRTPVYHERPEALRINKPLMKCDTHTPDLFNGILSESITSK